MVGGISNQFTGWRVRALARCLLIVAVLTPSGFLLAQTGSTGTTLSPLAVHFVNPPTAAIDQDTYLSAEVNRPVEWVRSVTFSVSSSTGSTNQPGAVTFVDGKPLYRFLLPAASLPYGSYQVAVTALTDSESAREVINVTIGTPLNTAEPTPTVTPPPVSGQIVQPVAGTMLSGRGILQAQVSRAVEGLNFYLRSTTSAGSGGEFVAHALSDTRTWGAEIDTTRWRNGYYDILAIAWDDSGSYTIGTVRVQIANQVTDADALQLAWVSPTSGVVEGAVTVAVMPSRPVDHVRVVITGPRSITLDALAGTNGGWVSRWDTQDWPVGSYRLQAYVDEPAATSAPLEVWIATSAGETSAATVQFVEVGPSGEVEGTIRLWASTQPLVNELGFLVLTASGGAAATIPGVFSSDRWEATWESGQLPPGDYSLVAVARLFGVEARSSAVALRVVGGVIAETTAVEPQVDQPNALAPLEDSQTVTGPLPTTPTRTSTVEAKPYLRWCASVGITDVERCHRRLLSDYRSGRRDTVCEILSDTPRDACLRQFPSSYVPSVCQAGEVTQIDICAQLIAETQLPQYCVNAGISDAQTCRTQLEESYASECASADVPNATCETFLRQQIDADVRCLDEASGDCSMDTLGDRTLEILFAQRTGHKVQAVVQPLVGHTTTLEPSRQPARPTASTEVTRLEELTPLRLTVPVRVAVLPATGGVVVGDDQVRLLPQAMVAVDRDGDGLPDDAERLVGSDPKVADSDGDGFGDAQEVSSGYSPIGQGSLQAPEAVVALARGATLEHPRSSSMVDAGLVVTSVGAVEGPAVTGTTFSGRGPTLGTVLLFIYSDVPLVVVTDVDAYGNWTYTLRDPLLDGHHEVYVTVNDATGRVVSKSSPLDFFVREARAVTAREYLGAQPLPRPSQPIGVYLAIAGGAAALGVGLFLLVSRQLRRNRTLSV